MRFTRRALARLSALIPAAVLAAGCGRQDGVSERAAALLADTARYQANIGGAEGDARSTLSRVITARMTDDGRHVVVLDAVPPFVRVFARDGSLRAAFIEPGSGPGEMRSPVALAVSGDSAVLVVDGAGRTVVYNLDGKPRVEAPGLGFPVLAVAPACGDEWVVYGPRFGQGRGRAQWLHRVRLMDGAPPRIVSAFEDSLAARSIAVGVAYGAVRTADSAALVRHTLGARRGMLEWACGGAAPRLTADPGSAPPRSGGTAGENGVRLEADAGTRMLAGLAAVTGGYAVADGVLGNGGEGDRTEITLVRGADRTPVTVPGGYRLWDGKAGVGVLMGSNDPLPRVFLIGEADFVSMF